MRVVFMGSPGFAVPALNALRAHHDVCAVVTQPDKPVGRGKKVQAPPVKVAAQEGVRPPMILQPTSVRGREFAEALGGFAADVGVVVAYGKILPQAVLDAFKHGCFNIHASLLPQYRGAAPIQRALMAGDVSTGITIMKLDAGMDTGPMVAQRSTPIGAEETAGDLFLRLAPLGAELLLQALEELEKGRLVVTGQDHQLASHAAMLGKGDGEIEWARDARLVSAHIRGVDPWPGASTQLQGKIIKLFGAVEVSGDGVPGEILAAGPEGLVVSCATGAVRVRECQESGKRRLAAADFVRGARLRLGAVLGGD